MDKEMKEVITSAITWIIAIVVIFSDFFFPGQTDEVYLAYSYFALAVLGCLFYGFVTEFMQRKRVVEKHFRFNIFERKGIAIYFITVCILYTTTILIFLIYPYNFLLRKYGIEDVLQYIIAGSTIVIMVQHYFTKIRFQIYMGSLLDRLSEEQEY